MKRIHIIGTGPRTGTTLIAEVMKVCFNIDCASEHEDRLYERPDVICNTYLTKYPSDLFIIWPSLFVDPNLYVICMVRDPRDSIVSKHGKNKSLFWSTLRYWKKFYPLLERYRSHPRFIEIKYEDFVKEPNQTQDFIIDNIPFLTKKYDFSEYHNVVSPSEESHKALLGVRPIGPQGLGKWKLNLDRVKQQIQLHGDISKDLIALGYEESEEWSSILDDVEPYDGGSFLPEYFTQQELFKRKKYKYFEAIRRLLARIHLINDFWPKKRNDNEFM